jgi:hypothetical protein
VSPGTAETWVRHDLETLLAPYRGGRNAGVRAGHRSPEGAERMGYRTSTGIDTCDGCDADR